jgi:aminomethyltransferase
VSRELVGLVLQDKGVLRNQHPVTNAQGESGQVTSGSFSPTLHRGIALARVPAGTRGDVESILRGRRVRARVVAPPFVRHGKPCEETLRLIA